jgi:hypothetical protein
MEENGNEKSETEFYEGRGTFAGQAVSRERTETIGICSNDRRFDCDVAILGVEGESKQTRFHGNTEGYTVC